MSKICGALNLRRYNFIDEELTANLNSLCSSTESILKFLTEKNVGLFQIDFYTKLEKSSTQKFFHSKTNKNLNLVADVQLTNRTELFEKFGVLPSEQDFFSDHHLILKAYEKWGEECPEHLVGDFAFVIWDEQNKKLFCSRDHFGASPLFYYKDDEKFIFGSQPKWILSFKNVEKNFNLNKLENLILPHSQIYKTNESWFENILPLPAGTSLTVDKKGIKSRRYWKPTAGKILSYKTEEEIIEAFRELFFEIIEARLSKNLPVAALLSGGLDSSSIVAVAAKVLEKKNREINVFAGVLANNNDEQFSDERFYIDQFKSFPNVKINYVSAPETGPFSNLEEFFDYNDSPYISSRYYLYSAFSEEAHKTGANTLFDGCFGEMGATFHGQGGFAEMFTKFRWLKLWRELKLRKSLYQDSIKYNIRANVINPLLPEFLIDLRHGKAKDQINEYHPLQKDLAQSLLNKIDFSKVLLSNFVSSDHRKNQINNMILTQAWMGENFSLNYTDKPVELRYPFLDKRLIEFAVAVPLDLKFKNGYSRYLIRAALDKILPPKIQWRTSKTPFSPDYMRRYNSQIGEVRDLLAEVKPNDPIREILDIEKIKKWADLPIADSERYTINETIARDHLPLAIYLIYFLRKFSEFRL